MKKFKKILIANRGEIALRIIRTARTMDIETVAVYSAGEENSPHVNHAGESVFLGAGELGETYLNIRKIIRAAVDTGSEAIHPGYGFLSENPLLSAACRESEIVFIGPSPQALELTGNKLETKTVAKNLGIPVLENFMVNPANLDKTIPELPYPVLVKSAHGGGGKGMQVIYSSGELIEKMDRSTRQAINFFGNSEVFLETYLENARHIEVQILGDNHGNFVHLFERDCSVQRNFQKIIEEAPAPGLDEQLREKLFGAALAVCRNIGLTGAATVEFLVVDNKAFYFLEINPRIQVEHPVTEEVTGIDIVREQLRIAAGSPLSFRQKEIKTDGHALEVRIYSEDPKSGFVPQSKPVSFFKFPQLENLRIESDIATDKSPAASQFDPILGKFITKGETREKAFSQMIETLNRTAISGPATNLQFLKALLQHPLIEQSAVTTAFCETHTNELISASENAKENVPFQLIIAAYLFHKFLTEEPHSVNPWTAIGFWNVLNETELYLSGISYNVPFSLLSPRFLKSGNKPLEKNIPKDATLFKFDWNGETFIAGAKRTSSDSVKICTEEYSETLIINDTEPEKTGIFLQGIEFFVENQELIENNQNHSHNETQNDSVENNLIVSHLHGKITDIQTTPGQIINKGETVLIIESMKSEIHVLAPKTAKVKSIGVKVGEQVQENKPLITLEKI
jgi:acetyl/propionyl-CoA carboxylase alpha subunit